MKEPCRKGMGKNKGYMGKIHSILGKTDSRTRNVSLNAILILLFKGGSILISLFYVPLLLNTLESTDYAIWLTLTSIIGWLVVTDIGLGNGLRNRLAECLAREEYSKGQKYISTSYVTLSAILSVTICFFLLFADKVDWVSILNSDISRQGELTAFVKVVFVSFCLQFSLSLLNSILLAAQLPALSSALNFIGQLTSFITVFILVHCYEVHSLLILGSTISIIPVVVYLIANIVFFSIRRELLPKPGSFSVDIIKDVLGVGIKFFFLQIIGIILFYSNNLIITHSVGNDAVVEYNIIYKYMNCIYMVFATVATPIWSAVTDAYTKGDIVWIKKINRKLVTFVILLAFLGGVMVLSSSWIFKLWLGNDTYCNYLSLILLLMYFIALSLYGCYGFVLNGIGKLHVQILVTSLLAIAYVPIAYWCGCRFGLKGILAVFLINQIINVCWSRIQYIRIINGKATGIWNK